MGKEEGEAILQSLRNGLPYLWYRMRNLVCKCGYKLCRVIAASRVSRKEETRGQIIGLEAKIGDTLSDGRLPSSRGTKYPHYLSLIGGIIYPLHNPFQHGLTGMGMAFRGIETLC